ncbi:3-dehydroquinate synthase [Balneola vulgaris]|uniref:3-dehydroquinate synthase n=1 Tax=Balneola vulgaris TaxID=287535 RepID=UPI00035C704F|nr:3-dehydroquinate synthase [Balneola vulgaris]
MCNQITLNINHSEQYSIHTGYDLRAELFDYLGAQFTTRKSILIVDENVNKLHANYFVDAVNKHFDQVITYVVPEGEHSKSLEHFEKILDLVLESGVDRKTPVLAVGGGVVGDLAGFVAASCLRGLPLIHIPTTLLAMVDSSIGGKTGINHTVGKNLIGAFYQPKAVFADLKFLETLSEQQWIIGLSEVIKYAMIRDASLFDLLDETSFKVSATDYKGWEQIIHRSAHIKVDVVAEDVKEAGIREFLNFGHTFAHVIERVGNYKQYSHGEAVFMGMWAAVYVSQKLGHPINHSNLSTFRPLYTSKLQVSNTPSELTALMLHDKKVSDGVVKLVLVSELEKPFTKLFKDTKLIDEAWAYTLEEFN